MKIYRGTILTLDSRNTIANTLVEDKGRIAYVGDLHPRQFRFSKKAEEIHLGDKVLIPSFVDSHIHFASYATFHAGLNVMEARSNAEILDMLRRFLPTTKDKLVIAFGALLFDMVRKKVEPLRGCHPATGEMNQEAFFAVSDFVTGSISLPKLVENMQRAADDLALRGIGMIHSVSGVGFTGDLDVDLERIFAKGLRTGQQMRVYMQTLNAKKAIRRKLPRVGGCFEAALDGCFGSKDAALRAPYQNSDERGVLYYSDEKVTNFCKAANRAGLQIEMHAIGDAAFDQATRAIAAALEDYPRVNHRHAIIHACLPTAEGIALCKRYNILLPVQTAFINWPQEPDEYLQEILGDRAKHLNPLRTFVKNGITLSAGSDGPCTDPDPMLWVHNAVNHSEPEQALTVFEALRMCTYNGYYTSFDERERGSLETGKIADMVILSQNPYTAPKSSLKDIKVEQTILSGKPYERQKESIAVHVLKGLVKGSC